MKYVDVVIDNNTDATDLCYTYSYDEPFENANLIQIGRKVYVPFGMSNRKVEGYVVALRIERPDVKLIKKIQAVDQDICLSEENIRTALWMRTRYVCRYIEAIKCFLPLSENKRKTKDPFEQIELKEEDSKDKLPTEEQKLALDKINKALNSNTHDVFLLKGVTGSGKTEVYLQAVSTAISQNRQAVIMVPEISLTPLLVSRFMSRFGKESVAVIHSKLTVQRRAEEYKRIANGEVKLVVGVRSAVFAPFKNLGLFILDEEHESSYKSDKSPKYDAKEVAIKRAMDSKAVVVLGSATPSVSDYFLAKTGVFKLITLSERYNKNPLPITEIVDLTSEVKKGNRSVVSVRLADEISYCLAKKEQVILFLNRRGYSSYVSCRECGFVLKCGECGIAMPYHKASNACVCHYCGRKSSFSKQCPVCGSKMYGGYGAGTEQVEETIKDLFPNANVDRLDIDSIKKKGELESILKRFEKHKTDILIGTQLVAKGLDFANVGLVGIINADTSLNLPDFRASERSFSLITQASGRAGRGENPGKVILQTYDPSNKVLAFAKAQDYDAFYDYEIDIRNATMYPPYSLIYQIMIMDENKEVCENYAKLCCKKLRDNLPDSVSVLGPAAPALLKADGMHRYQILIKAEPNLRKKVSEEIRQLKESKDKDKNAAKIVSADINPYSFI